MPIYNSNKFKLIREDPSKGDVHHPLGARIFQSLGLQNLLIFFHTSCPCTVGKSLTFSQ